MRLVASLAIALGLFAPFGCGGGSGGGPGGSADFPFASLVVGQTGFTTGLHDMGQATTGPSGLANPCCVAIGGGYALVVDAFCSRILGFVGAVQPTDPTADLVIGQSDLRHGATHDDDQDGTKDANPSGRTLWNPEHLLSAAGRLYVPDFSNHRVLVFDT